MSDIEYFGGFFFYYFKQKV